MNKQFDIIIVGSGFSGSLMALIMHQLGYRVCLLEEKSHPRFAIGESSTPIGDMILRDLAERYDLPWLKYFSRYGSWQKHYPAIPCGIKRGFSYFKHEPGTGFITDPAHHRELLVAASVDSNQSDTNWLRSEFDAFLVNKVREAGISYFDKTSIIQVDRENEFWQTEARREDSPLAFQASWLVDATGSSRFLTKFMNITQSAEGFKTHSSALFSHFVNVTPWSDWLDEQGIDQSDYPFNPDHSALHHLLDEGWLWMLRFNNGLTSAGIVFNHNYSHDFDRFSSPELWTSVLEKYPSLQQLFRQATLCEHPGSYIRTNRLQRRLSKITGEGWVALPHTAGFVDPLHSTGIAHTLSGVERIAHIFQRYGDTGHTLKRRLKVYGQSVLDEINFIDLLVSGCTDSVRHVELFNLYSMLYFTAAIAYEQNRLNGSFNIENDRFLYANHPGIRRFTKQHFEELQALLVQKNPPETAIISFRGKIKQSIKPFNTANLLQSPIPNMYSHTAVKMD